MMQFVVNSKLYAYDVYVGRPGPFGNPFSHLPKTSATFCVRTRQQAVDAFENYVRDKPEFVARIKRELRGKILGCPCSGYPCHGEVLARIANE